MLTMLKSVRSAIASTVPFHEDHPVQSWVWFIGTTVVKYVFIVALILLLPWKWATVYLVLYVLHLSSSLWSLYESEGAFTVIVFAAAWRGAPWYALISTSIIYGAVWLFQRLFG